MGKMKSQVVLDKATGEEFVRNALEALIDSDEETMLSLNGCKRLGAIMFLDHGGLAQLFDVQKNDRTILGISKYLVDISYSSRPLERLASYSADVAQRLVQLVLQLLYSSFHYEVKVNALLFLKRAFTCRKIIRAFDSQNGLESILTILRSLTAKEMNQWDWEVMVCEHCCDVLGGYFRWSSTHSLPALTNFLKVNGHAFLLDLLHRGVVNLHGLYNDQRLYRLAPHLLEILQLVSLYPEGRESITKAKLDNGIVGLRVVLDAADGFVSYFPEVLLPALDVLNNLVCEDGCATLGTEQAQIFKGGDGIQVLLRNFDVMVPCDTFYHFRSLVCRVLIGLSRDKDIADILRKLLNLENLLELVGKQTDGTGKSEFINLVLELFAVVSSPTAASTHFSHPSSELLQLIHGHLEASDFTITANSLVNEAQMELPHLSQISTVIDPQSQYREQMTLHSSIADYRQPHLQYPAPIMKSPRQNILHQKKCPASRHSSNVPANITARLRTCQFGNRYSGGYGSGSDRQFVYSKFRRWRTWQCEDELLTCINFLGDSSQIAAGTGSGQIVICDYNRWTELKSSLGHSSEVTIVHSALSAGTHLVLSSTDSDACLWDAASISGGYKHFFPNCKSAKFSNSGTGFAALSLDPDNNQVLLYDTRTCKVKRTLKGTIFPMGSYAEKSSPVHFSPSDQLLLWNGTLWDKRVSDQVASFIRYTNFGGGGFHPSGNEVILNSEVWDVRKFKLLRSIQALDYTRMTFNRQGDIIYSISRRNMEDFMFQFSSNSVEFRHESHSLFGAFSTIDAFSYSSIARVPVNECVLDFANAPDESTVGLVTLSEWEVRNTEDLASSVRFYKVGLKRFTDSDEDFDSDED